MQVKRPWLWRLASVTEALAEWLYDKSQIMWDIWCHENEPIEIEEEE